jgi:hypothetical protein
MVLPLLRLAKTPEDCAQLIGSWGCLTIALRMSELLVVPLRDAYGNPACAVPNRQPTTRISTS